MGEEIREQNQEIRLCVHCGAETGLYIPKMTGGMLEPLCVFCIQATAIKLSPEKTQSKEVWNNRKDRFAWLHD